MALSSDLKSCLLWETERPYSGSPRRSSFFRLFGEEWFLKLEHCSSGYSGFYGKVHLCSRNGETTNRSLSVSCHVITGRLAFSSEQISYRNSGQEMLRFSPDDLRNSTGSAKWKVFCRLSCGVGPLSLQLNNETILLSNGSQTTTDRSVQTYAEIPPDLQRLSEDFSSLLEKEIVPDATVTCGGRTWKVHRSVLTARSEVFAAMFRSGMAESETGAVRVEDLEAAVLDSLLKYVYGGKVPDVSDGNVSSVYEAADRYALLGLRKACSDWMTEHLSQENCLGFLVVADAHGDVQLKETVVSFVTEHFAQIEKALWTDFRKEHPFLAIEILERFAPAMKR